MKSYKKILPFFLVLALFASAYYSLNSKRETSIEYKNALMSARDYAEKELLDDAVAEYSTALAIEPSLSVMLEVGELYMDFEEYSSAKKWYENQLLENYPTEAATYLYGVNLYLAQNNYRSAYTVYDEYLKRGMSLQEVEDAMDSVRYEYTLLGVFEAGSVFSNAAGVAAAKYEGNWGYVDTDGDRALPYIYEEARVFGNYASVIDDDGNAVYIDTSGNVKINDNCILEKDPDFGKVVKFECIQSNMILAYNGKIWNYYSLDTYEKVFGGYKGAYPIANGVGAVSEDGKKWCVIDTEGNELTESKYDQILADEKSIVCWKGTLIAEENSKFYLINAQGDVIGNNHYQDAKAFNGADSYAAVKKDGNWLFVDEKGQEYSFGEYEDAQSFSNGLAAVKQDGLWGYINTDGEIVIPCMFLDAEPFNKTGLAFVETREDNWQLLSLYIYNHD